MKSLLSHSVIAFALLGTYLPPAEADTDDAKRNCVDRCIVEFARRLGKDVSYAELDAAISSGQMDKEVAFRNLADCMRLLDRLGIPTIAREIHINGRGRYPALTILFIPPPGKDLLGHVSVMSEMEDHKVDVFDPAGKPERYVADGRKPLRDVRTISIIPKSHADREYFIRFAQFSVGLLIALGVVLYCRGRFRVSRPAVVNSPLVSPLLLVLLFCGCGSDSQTPESFLSIKDLERDHGVIDLDQAPAIVSDNFILSNCGKNSITVIARVNCSCVKVPDDLQAGRVLASGETTTIPVSIGLEAKFGDFVETIRIYAQGNDVQEYKLAVKGCVARCPVPSLHSLNIRALAMQETSQTFEITHVYKEEHDHSEIKSIVIESDEPEVKEKFRTGEIVRKSAFSFGGRPADVWTLPVFFKAGEYTPLQVKTAVRIEWTRPMCSTVVEVVGITRPDVELPPRVYLPDAVMGSEAKTAIPVHINNRESLSRLSVNCPPEWACKFHEEASKLEISLVPAAMGEGRAEFFFESNGRRVSEKSTLFWDAQPSPN